MATTDPGTDFLGPANRKSITQGLEGRYKEGSLYIDSFPTAGGASAPGLDEQSKKGGGVNFFGGKGNKSTSGRLDGHDGSGNAKSGTGLSGNMMDNASTAGVVITGFSPRLTAGERSTASGYGADITAIRGNIKKSMMLANFPTKPKSYGEVGPGAKSLGDSKIAGRHTKTSNTGRGFGA